MNRLYNAIVRVAFYPGDITQEHLDYAHAGALAGFDAPFKGRDFLDRRFIVLMPVALWDVRHRRLIPHMLLAYEANGEWRMKSGTDPIFTMRDSNAPNPRLLYEIWDKVHVCMSGRYMWVFQEKKWRATL